MPGKNWSISFYATNHCDKKNDTQFIDWNSIEFNVMNENRVRKGNVRLRVEKRLVN